MKEISDKLYHQLKRLGIIDADTRSHNVGASDYSKHLFQPWTAWIEYNLNAFDADILKRVLRTKEGEDRRTDLIRSHAGSDDIKKNETIAQSFYEWAKKNLEL